MFLNLISFTLTFFYSRIQYNCTDCNFPRRFLCRQYHYWDLDSTGIVLIVEFQYRPLSTGTVSGKLAGGRRHITNLAYFRMYLRLGGARRTKELVQRSQNFCFYGASVVQLKQVLAHLSVASKTREKGWGVKRVRACHKRIRSRIFFGNSLDI